MSSISFEIESGLEMERVNSESVTHVDAGIPRDWQHRSSVSIETSDDSDKTDESFIRVMFPRQMQEDEKRNQQH